MTRPRPYPRIATVSTRLLVFVLVLGLAPAAPAQAPPLGKDDARSFPTPAEIAASSEARPRAPSRAGGGGARDQSPVAMAFDEEGRLWVVEMRDYPHGPPAGPAAREPDQGPRRPRRRRPVRDEHRSSRTGSRLPTACSPGAGGPWSRRPRTSSGCATTTATARPIGDEVLFEGFSALNPQLRVSHPNLGLDGWVYVANGLRGGKVQAARPDDAAGDRRQRHGLPLRPEERRTTSRRSRAWASSA